MTQCCTAEDLTNMAPRHEFFVGIDSDGCVFDTMEIKQKACFHGSIVEHWHLQPAEKWVREAAEFVNLYSKWRGSNRFPALVRTFDLVRRRKEVAATDVEIPILADLRRFIDSGAPLGNSSLEEAAKRSGSPELASILEWSRKINRIVAEKVKSVPPFPWAVKSLEELSRHADVIVVSQTPAEALQREWEENDLVKYIRMIAGQELGTKADHIRLASAKRYGAGHVLMIGDAPGDLKAARANGSLFFPVRPGREDASWKVFREEAMARFFNGTYGSDYQEGIVREFEALLPETPPWETGG